MNNTNVTEANAGIVSALDTLHEAIEDAAKDYETAAGYGRLHDMRYYKARGATLRAAYDAVRPLHPYLPER